MRPFFRVLLLTGLCISLGFGLWHFAIPYQYRWHSYLPKAPRAIRVSIDWINFFFSLLLSGNSAVLILFRKRIYQRDPLAITMSAFMTVIWFSRVAITLIRPWTERFTSIKAEQITGFSVIFLLFLIPLLSLTCRTKK
jgi:hypothetical protein